MVRIIFAGTPEFAANALESILTTAPRHEVVAVLTQPDRPAGRGMQLTASAVKRVALRAGLELLQPVSLKDGEIQRVLQGYQADVMVVAAYGIILPKAVLTIPRLGCINIHASLLPRWRGAAPVQRAILAGDQETGITIMQMDEGLDTGDMLLKQHCPIAPADTGETLLDKLTRIGAAAVIEALDGLAAGELGRQVQDSTLATYAAKLTKTEAKIDWGQSCEQVHRAIRAYNPFPVAHSTLDQTPIKIWQGAPRPERSGEPGKVLSVEQDGILVACGSGAILLEILQRPNSKALSANQFVQGFAIKPGARFDIA